MLLGAGKKAVIKNQRQSSETEPHLQLDDASGKRSLRLTELRIAGHAVVADGGVHIVQVQLVEHVVEIALELELGVFTQRFQLGQAEGLRQLEVVAEVSGT